MHLKDVKTGTKIELELFNDYNEKIRPNFASQMEHCTDENHAIIAAPIYEGNIYPVRTGWHFNAYFMQKDDLYKFRGRIAGRGVNDGIAHLRVEQTGEIMKIQRRQFFRFECFLPVKYRNLDPNGDTSEPNPFKKAVTFDLSGGGTAIKTEEEIKLDEILECEIKLGEGRVIRFRGKVVRSVKRNTDAKYCFEAGLLFENMENRDKEAIIKYIFEEQRKLRKKGLI